MYLFLANLSFSDIGFISTVIPKMLNNIGSGSRWISYGGCLTQLYFFGLFADLDNFLLAVMALDRYVAIQPASPLCHYHELPALHPVGGWVMGGHYLPCPSAHPPGDQAFLLWPQCHPHFFCDLVPLPQSWPLSTYANDLVLILVAGTLLIGPSVCILMSYFYICIGYPRNRFPKG